MPYADPLAVSGFFLRPVKAGPARIDAQAVHAGRRLATGQATLIRDGETAIRALASFTDLREATTEPRLIHEGPPSLPPPDELADPSAGVSMPGLTLLDRVEYRLPERPGWLDGRPSGVPRVEFWMRFSDGRDADPLSLPFLVDAFAPAIAELGVPSYTVELTVHVRAHPAPVNLIQLALHPDGLAPRLLNLPEVRTSLLGRLARQARRTGDAELIRLHDELIGYGQPDGSHLPEPTEIALPIRVVHRGRELCLINTITTFGTAFDITLDDIAIEAFLPADEATAATLHSATDLSVRDRP